MGFPSADAVPSLEDYARTMYADSLMYRDQGKEMASMLCDKLGDLARVVFYEIHPERREMDHP
jgi:hypothetical protein